MSRHGQRRIPRDSGITGSSAPSSRLRATWIALAAAAFLLVPVSQAWAIGSIDLTIAGSGAGKVTSTSNGVAAPGDIDCDYDGAIQTGTCAASYTGGESGFFADVVLTGNPAPGFYLVGWTQSGASAAARCTTPPEANPSCKVDLDGFSAPGPTAAITATFAPLPDPPVANTGASSEINPYLTEFQGTVDPSEFAVSACHFEYGPTAAYGTSVPCTPKASELGAGSTPVAVSGETEPLEPNTTYHYRLVASNLGGSHAGADQTFATGSFDPGGCNAERRAEQGIAALLLPDCMALEMVSPPQKEGQPAAAPTLSVNGDRAVFRSSAPLGNTSGVLSPVGDIYVASRTASGWNVAPTVPPARFPRGWSKFPVAQSFSPDLSHWLQVASSFSQFEMGIGQAFRGGLDGIFSPLSPLLIPPGQSGTPAAIEGLRPEAVTADHSQFYFSLGQASATYLPGDPLLAGPAVDKNVYITGLHPSGEPSLRLLARDSAGKVWGERCGVRMGGNKTANKEITRNQGVVSPDGSRTYFSTRADQPQEGFCTEASKMRILVRTETPSGPDIAPLFPGSECTRVSPACSTADGDDRYQGASIDGTKVYFTTSRQLADSDTDATNDLYLHNSEEPIGQRLIQVSAGDATDATPGVGANVQGNVTALSTDGSHVYFVATDVLGTDANPVGATALGGQMNLYLWKAATGFTSFVGTLASGDSSGLWGDRGGFQNGAYPVPATGQFEGEEVGGDGHILLLQSKASLTGSDVDSGRLDVFRYDSVDSSLWCISCEPGGPDGKLFDVYSRGDSGAAVTDFAERGRWVSENGETVVFSTAQPLIPGDGNSAADSFVWRDGEIYRLPGRAYFGNETLETNAPALSHDGDEVAFQTGTQLLPQDGDGAPDVYVARVGGGFPSAVAAEPCQIDESLPGAPCQGRLDAPLSASPISEKPGAGNPPVTRKRCKKGFVRNKKGNCVKKPRNHKRTHNKKKNASKNPQTNSDRRAAK